MNGTRETGPMVNGYGKSDTHPNGIMEKPAFNQQAGPSPIAICGIALRLPGGVRDTEGFWDLLANGRDARGPIPTNRYNAEGFNNTLGTKGSIQTQFGYFLEDDLASVDSSFFSMTLDELRKTDPQQRLILEVTRECLENAGETAYRGKPIGCYVGTFSEDWLHIGAKDPQYSGQYVMNGHLDFMIANRVSYEYDFCGPRSAV